MKNRFSYFLAVVAMGLLAAAPTFAGVTQNIKVPWSADVFVPCANGGLGEVLAISGRLHILLTLTEDSAGGLHMSFHYQPQRVFGYGSETGDVYRAVGITRSSTNIGAEGLPYVGTFVDHFYMIGTAGGVNFTSHTTSHFTVNANGELSAEVDNTSTSCM